MNGLPLKLRYVLSFNSVNLWGERWKAGLSQEESAVHHLRVDLKKRFILLETYMYDDIIHLRELDSDLL